MRIGTQEFDTKNQTYIMGILNVTPDSFSDGEDTISWTRRCFTRKPCCGKEPPFWM